MNFQQKGYQTCVALKKYSMFHTVVIQTELIWAFCSVHIGIKTGYFVEVNENSQVKSSFRTCDSGDNCEGNRRKQSRSSSTISEPCLLFLFAVSDRLI